MEELFFWDNYPFDSRETLFFYSDSLFFLMEELFFEDNYSFDLREALNLYIDSPLFLREELFFLDNYPFPFIGSANFSRRQLFIFEGGVIFS